MDYRTKSVEEASREAYWDKDRSKVHVFVNSHYVGSVHDTNPRSLWRTLKEGSPRLTGEYSPIGGCLVITGGI